MSAAVCEVPIATPRRIPPRGPRCGMGRQSPLTQAMDLQAIAMTAARDPNVPPHIKAALMRAWTDLQDVIMAIRGHGRPKPVEARNATPKRKRSETAPVVYPSPGEASQAAVVGERKGE